MKANNVTNLPERESTSDFRLSALDRLSTVDAQELVLELAIDTIDPDPSQPRSQFNEESLQELAACLRYLGQIQPIEVREAGERYVLIDGERRWRAAKIAKVATLRALVRFAPGTPNDVLDRQFAANFQREAMALIDQARYLQKRIDTLGSASAVSDAIGLSVPRILNIVKTLRADGAAAELRDSGLTRDADTIGAVVEVQKHDPTAADALVASAREKGKLTRKEAQDAARVAKSKARGNITRDDDAGDGTDVRGAAARDFSEGRGSGQRKPKLAEPTLVVLLACDGSDAQRAQWNKLSRQYGRAHLSLIATSEQPGCVLVEFGAYSEPFPVDALRILDAHYETEKRP
ncbi:MAG TPA: ParB/RepB/Spo0J family partition protein [Rudaea sp.]|jgi:ParB family chromosome partitioning protein|nr:ParB/RepB/Spo0J family partition protein [Rudaea sp.]